MNATLRDQTLRDLPVLELLLYHGPTTVGGEVELACPVQIQDLVEEHGAVIEEVFVRLGIVFGRGWGESTEARVGDLLQC